MALLTPTQFAEHHDHDLSDAAIQRLLDDAEDAIESRFGGASQTEWHRGNSRLIFLARKTSSITSITETISEDDTVLAVDDYQLEAGGLQIRWLDDGTNGRTFWGDRVKVVYTPTTDDNRRKRVQLDLVKLAIQFQGMDSQRVGDVSLTTRMYQQRREEILSELAPALGIH